MSEPITWGAFSKVLVLVGTIGLGVWAASESFTNKADASDVRTVEKEVNSKINELREDVVILKHQQQANHSTLVRIMRWWGMPKSEVKEAEDGINHR